LELTFLGGFVIFNGEQDFFTIPDGVIEIHDLKAVLK